METLLQLLQTDGQNTFLPLVDIRDVPRFPWRGVLLDSARHFLPLPDILRQLDGMAAAKLNVFHWHLTDDQGWRFASEHYPKLQQQASDGQFYTREQMRQVVAYATARGIRVVPEIDMPGHASSIAVAYPDLMSAPGPYRMEREWGVHKPTLDPTRDEVYQFVDTIVGELAAIFPIPICTSAATKLTPASGARRRRFRRLCSRTGWRIPMRCRPTSTRSWKRSSRSTSGRWSAGTRSTTRRCRVRSSFNPGRARLAGCQRPGRLSGHSLHRFLSRSAAKHRLSLPQ